MWNSFGRPAALALVWSTAWKLTGFPLASVPVKLIVSCTTKFLLLNEVGDAAGELIRRDCPGERCGSSCG
jgi:hypothetical protein